MEIMGAKLDQFGEAIKQIGESIKQNIELGRETLNAIQNAGEVHKLHTEYLQKDLDRLRDVELQELKKKFGDCSALNSKLFGRVEKLEDVFAKEYGRSTSRDGLTDFESKNKWLHYSIGKAVVYIGGGVVLAVAVYLIKGLVIG